ncbi:MAG: LptF/LptG family permease, partial [Planctomycetota bacterium]
LDELVLPAVTEDLAAMEDVLLEKESSWCVVAYNEHGLHLYAEWYDRLKGRLKGVTLTKLDRENVPRFRLDAEEADWDAEKKLWSFRAGVYQEFDEKGHPKVRGSGSGRPVVEVTKFGAEGFVLPDLQLRPADMRRTSFLGGGSTRLAELREKMKRFPQIPSFRLQFHSKLAFPLSPLVLLLLGLPFVVAVGTSGITRGLALCLLVSMCYYAAHFMCMDLGHRGRIAAELAAWLPTMLFGGAGIILFARIRT